MAINKKLIHFNKKSTFNSQKLSANDANTQYQTGGVGAVQTGAPDINYQSIVYIKDSKEIWTHGQFYGSIPVIDTIKRLGSAQAGQWLRIATLNDEQYCSSLFTIKEGSAGMTFFFKCGNSDSTVKVLDQSDNIYLTKLRILRKAGNPGFVEMYVKSDSSNIATNTAMEVNMKISNISVTGSVPSGYSTEEISLV